MRIEMRVKDVELIVEKEAKPEDMIYAIIDKCEKTFFNMYSASRPIIVDGEGISRECFDGIVKVVED